MQSSTNSTGAAASGSRRRREFVAAGEGLVPPLFLLDSWDRQGLIKHMLLQVPVPDARGSRVPTTPERRRSAAVVKLPHRRIHFTCELAFFSFER
jgi:hypothetical protein